MYVAACSLCAFFAIAAFPYTCYSIIIHIACSFSVQQGLLCTIYYDRTDFGTFKNFCLLLVVHGVMYIAL